jgi:hypothetical protein
MKTRNLRHAGTPAPKFKARNTGAIKRIGTVTPKPEPQNPTRDPGVKRALYWRQ